MLAMRRSSRIQLSSSRRRMRSERPRRPGRFGVPQGFARGQRIEILGRIGDAAPESRCRR
jgi:hypothetical protein